MYMCDVEALTSMMVHHHRRRRRRWFSSDGTAWRMWYSWWLLMLLVHSLFSHCFQHHSADMESSPLVTHTLQWH